MFISVLTGTSLSLLSSLTWKEKSLPRCFLKIGCLQRRVSAAGQARQRAGDIHSSIISNWLTPSETASTIFFLNEWMPGFSNWHKGSMIYTLGMHNLLVLSCQKKIMLQWCLLAEEKPWLLWEIFCLAWAHRSWFPTLQGLRHRDQTNTCWRWGQLCNRHQSACTHHWNYLYCYHFIRRNQLCACFQWYL